MRAIKVTLNVIGPCAPPSTLKVCLIENNINMYHLNVIHVQRENNNKGILIKVEWISLFPKHVGTGLSYIRESSGKCLGNC